MASGSYTSATAFNAEFRNPNILSGVEFVQTSGAPTTNEFKVFKLNNSFAEKDSENYLINNSVIKCKSLGGLPRLRFDLSSYGDRPNHFIKNHDFKLKVNALVGDDDSQLLGGGQLGVWIHTKPISRRNPNLLSYTVDPWNSPGMDYASLVGSYWKANSNTYVNSFSSILETNPFGGPSSIELSSLEMTGAMASTPYIQSIVASSTIADGYPAQLSKTYKEAYQTIFSVYVKKPTDNAVSAFMLGIPDVGDPDGESNNIKFEFIDSATAPTFKSTAYWYNNHSIESVGNEWYRINLMVSGLGSGLVNGDTVEDDPLIIQIWFGLNSAHGGDQAQASMKRLWIYAPQLEQYPTGTFKNDIYKPELAISGTASPYQAVAGAEPVYGNEVSGFMWSWTPANKWVMHREDELSINTVLGLSHLSTYKGTYQPPPDETSKCIKWQQQITQSTPDVNLQTIQKEWFETFEVDFDTRNETIHNNSEYLEVIPIPNEFAKIQPLVNMDTTPYYVEVFFMPNNSPGKYLLIDSIELQDVTQRDNAGIGLGHGVETSGTPLRPFVTEDKLELDKEQLTDVLKFYNGLMGSGIGLYATNLASRDATITSGTLEVSGGSRLNYRLSPTWGYGNANNIQPNYNSFSSLEIDN